MKIKITRKQGNQYVTSGYYSSDKKYILCPQGARKMLGLTRSKATIHIHSKPQKKKDEQRVNLNRVSFGSRRWEYQNRDKDYCSLSTDASMILNNIFSWDRANNQKIYIRITS